MRIPRESDRITVHGALAGEVIHMTITAPNGEILAVELVFDANLNVIDSEARVVGVSA